MENDPWGLSYRIVTKKLAVRPKIPGLSDPDRVREIVQTLFLTYENRMQGIAKNGAGTHGELFGMGELQEAGKRLQAGKAPGPDGIPKEVLRVILEVWPELLLEMYNSCLSKRVFPSRWKQQKLVLLRKGKKPLNEPSSYRPICLIDTMGKLLEVVNTAKTVNQDNWRKKGFCAVILLDVRNAFNSIKWERIMKALEKRETLEYLLRMVDSYLSDRKLEYETDQGKKEYAVTAVVPQGSVLGPFLWNVTYDDFLEIKLPERATLMGFADDVAMVVTADCRTTGN